MAVVRFMVELHRRLQASGETRIKCVAAHPGIAVTSIAANSNANGMYCITSCCNSLVMRCSSQSEEDGALPFLCALGSPNCESGDMWAPADAGIWPQCHGAPFRYQMQGAELEQNITDLAAALRCWELTEGLLVDHLADGFSVASTQPAAAPSV